jgi:hypothetical protein
VPSGRMQPGSFLSPNWMVRSLAEIVRHARAFSERFENPTSVSFRFEWQGYKAEYCILQMPYGQCAPRRQVTGTGPQRARSR